MRRLWNSRAIVFLVRMQTPSMSDSGNSDDESPTLSLFGAPGDTGNYGLTALLESTLAGFSRGDPDVRLNVYDNGLGHAGRGRSTATSTSVGARGCRGVIYLNESLWNLRVSARLGGLANPNARALLSSRAVLDVSGGDSFSDIYGPKRFAAVALPKRIALEANVPLVLLPQTYGPFSEGAAWGQARAIVRGVRRVHGPATSRAARCCGSCSAPTSIRRGTTTVSTSRSCCRRRGRVNSHRKRSGMRSTLTLGRLLWPGST